MISASYIGTNENAVSESIARMIQDGMTSGSMLCEGSPAKKLEFDAFVGTNAKGGHGALILDTYRGMTAPQQESSDLTRYGILFVVFVALLSVGVIFAVLYKRKKKKQAIGTAAEEDFERNLELEEGTVVEMSGNDNGFGANDVELSLSPKSVT